MFRATDGCLFFFLLSVAWSLPATDGPIETTPAANNIVPETAESDNTRIVGGQAVQNRTLFAYQVSLRSPGHICGGSLIDTQHIVTAAHCVINNEGKAVDPSTLVAVLGDLRIDSTSNTTVRNQVKHIFVNEKYNQETQENDIALLRVSTNFTLSPEINKIGISQSTPKDNTSCVVSGWGTLVEGASYTSATLQFVEVPIVPLTTCNISYANIIRSGMVCAGYISGGKDSCQGDSGGPLVCNDVLAGIVSFGYGCARPGYPGVYTDVSHYIPWIQTQMQRSSSSIAFLHLYLLVACIFMHTRL